MSIEKKKIDMMLGYLIMIKSSNEAALTTYQIEK